MNMHRRSFLTMSAALLAVATTAALWPLRALAQWTRIDAAFEAKAMDAVFASLGGTPEPSSEITFMTPEIAENGAVVPVGVRSNLPKTEMIALLVEKNPNALAGAYTLLEGAEPDVNMRIKMGQSSDVYALVKADGKFYMTKKEIKVTLGGCGG